MRLLLMSAFGCVWSAAILSDQILIDCFLRAMGITRTPAKAMFSELGLSQTQWSRQTNGAEPPRFLGRLGRIQSAEGLEVMRWYAVLKLHRLGLPQELLHAADVARGLKKMAKAGLGISYASANGEAGPRRIARPDRAVAGI